MSDVYGVRITGREGHKIKLRLINIFVDEPVLPQACHKGFFLNGPFLEEFDTADRDSFSTAWQEAHAGDYIEEVTLDEIGNFPPRFKSGAGRLDKKGKFSGEDSLCYADYTITVKDLSLFEKYTVGYTDSIGGIIAYRERQPITNEAQQQFDSLLQKVNADDNLSSVDLDALIGFLDFEEKLAISAAKLLSRIKPSFTDAQRKIVSRAMMEGGESGSFCAVCLAPIATDSEFNAMLLNVSSSDGAVYMQAALNAWRDRPYLVNVLTGISKKHDDVPSAAAGMASVMLYSLNPDEKGWKDVLKKYKEDRLPLSAAAVFDAARIEEILAEVEKVYKKNDTGLAIANSISGIALALKKVPEETRNRWYTLLLSAATGLATEGGYDFYLKDANMFIAELFAAYPERHNEITAESERLTKLNQDLIEERQKQEKAKEERAPAIEKERLEKLSAFPKENTYYQRFADLLAELQQDKKWWIRYPEFQRVDNPYSNAKEFQTYYDHTIPAGVKIHPDLSKFYNEVAGVNIKCERNNHRFGVEIKLSRLEDLVSGFTHHDKRIGKTFAYAGFASWLKVYFEYDVLISGGLPRIAVQYTTDNPYKQGPMADLFYTDLTFLQFIELSLKFKGIHPWALFHLDIDALNIPEKNRAKYVEKNFDELKSEMDLGWEDMKLLLSAEEKLHYQERYTRVQKSIWG